MKALHTLIATAITLMATATFLTLFPAMNPSLTWFSAGICAMAIVAITIELIQSYTKGRVSLSAVVSMITILIIAGMLTGWILSGYNAQIGPQASPSWIVNG